MDVNFCKDHRDKIEVPDPLAVEDLINSKLNNKRKLARLITQYIAQSLNSPFFPPLIGAEPGRAKEESRITCMRMLRTPPFFPPNSGEKPYLEVRFRFGLRCDFVNNIQATISAFRLLKDMSVN